MICYFIKFRDYFGAPNTGLHKFKILDTAMIDYWLTIVLSFMWSYITGMPLVLSTILMFIVGFILHVIFGVPTHLVKYLNLQC